MPALRRTSSTLTRLAALMCLSLAVGGIGLPTGASAEPAPGGCVEQPDMPPGPEDTCEPPRILSDAECTTGETPTLDLEVFNPNDAFILVVDVLVNGQQFGDDEEILPGEQYELSIEVPGDEDLVIEVFNADQSELLASSQVSALGLAECGDVVDFDLAVLERCNADGATEVVVTISNHTDLEALVDLLLGAHVIDEEIPVPQNGTTQVPVSADLVADELNLQLLDHETKTVLDTLDHAVTQPACPGVPVDVDEVPYTG